MPLCYLITCHASADLVTDLLRYIHAPDSLYLIHCDPKASIDLRQRVVSLCQSFENVSELPSCPYGWAGYSQVAVTLQAISEAMRSPLQWTHFIQLSEQHVPLRSQQEITHRLRAGVSYIRAAPAASMNVEAQRDLKNRFDIIYRELSGVGSFATDLTRIHPKLWARLYHGSNWYVLARPACQRILNLSTDKSITLPFEHSIHADETMVQTLLLSHEFGAQLPVEPVDLTFQATPTAGGTPDTVFTEELYWTTRDADRLFIRKRPSVLPDSVREDLEKRANVACGPFGSAPPPITSTATAHSLVAEIRNRLYSDSWYPEITCFDPHRLPNVPGFYIALRTASMPRAVDVRAMSEDLHTFKVLILAQVSFNGDYNPTLIGDRAALLLRARVYDMFFAREIHMPEDTTRGFVNRRDLVAAIEWRLGEAERIGGLSETGCLRPDQVDI